MRIYVDGEMPRECWGCPCFRTDIECCCGLDDGTNDYFLDEIDGGECPLQSLAEHDKQSQNSKAIEVLEKVKEIILQERKITAFKFDTFNKGKDVVLFWINAQIDNQIKELGGNNND